MKATLSTFASITMIVLLPCEVLSGRQKALRRRTSKESDPSSSYESKQNKLSSFNRTFNENFFIGTQAIYSPDWKSYRISPYAGHLYSEAGFDMLTELRESVALTGSNHFKFKLSSNVCESYHLACQDNEITSLKELSQVSEVKDTFADPALQWYHLWVYSYNLPKVLMVNHTADLLEAEFKETYEWATHMLKTYQNTNKVFFVGNWEGDWELMWSSGCRVDGKFDFSCVPSQENIVKYINWASIRQNAIDQAKTDANVEGVDMFYYIEFNLESNNYENHPDVHGMARPTILNSVVPFVNPDFLSYSSYKSTNKYIDHRETSFDQVGVDNKFWSLLDYAESRLLPKPATDFSVMGDGLKRVFIGEFGPLRSRSSDLFVPTAALVIRASLEWGCPFVLHWETYDNYSNTEPLVAEDLDNLSTLYSVRLLFKKWTDDAKDYIANNNPAPNDLRQWAVQWFGSIAKTSF